MPYVVRNPAGQVVSLHRHDPGVGEYLEADHPVVRGFLGLDEASSSEFERLDLEFVRVLEDLIEALASRHLINLTDLPDTAQAKLFSRKSYRSRVRGDSLNLFDPGGGGVI